MEEPLWDETLVVRGGLMELYLLHDSIATGLALDGTHNLSFWGENGMSLEEVCAAAFAAGDLKNAKIRVSSVGKLRAAGLEPVRSEPFPHLTVTFSRKPTDIALEALVDLFDAPILNPNFQG